MSFRKLAIKVVIFVLLVFIVDRAVGFAFAKVYRLAADRGGSGLRGEGTVYSTLNAKADVVVLGHSRARYDYDTRILNDTLDASVYDAGKSGQGLWYILAMVDLLSRSYTPKLYILEVDPPSLVFMKEQRERIDFLAPFIDRSPVIRRLIFSTRTFEPIKYLLHCARYNSRLSMIVNNLRLPDKTINGFMPIGGKQDDTDPDADEATLFGEIDQGLVSVLHETLDTAKRAGVSVVMVSAPMFRKDASDPWQFDLMARKIESIARQHDVPLIEVDAREYPEFANPALFRDAGHLNAEGAAIFTTIVADQIRELIDQGELPPIH